MPNDALYEQWESGPARWVQRSYLYSLAPIGVGTPAVESFTGYIARLAAAHSVETGTLVNHELLPRIPFTKGEFAGCVPSKLPTCFFLSAFPLNGLGERPRLWVSLLEKLTCIDRLDLLTCLPWAKVLSAYTYCGLNVPGALSATGPREKLGQAHMKDCCGPFKRLPSVLRTAVRSNRSADLAAKPSTSSLRDPKPVTVRVVNVGWGVRSRQVIASWPSRSISPR